MHGKAVSSSGTKAELLDRVFARDRDSVRNIFKPLSETNRMSVQQILDNEEWGFQHDYCLIDNYRVHFGDFQCGRSNQAISVDVMKLFVILFRKKDWSISEAFRVTNNNNPTNANRRKLTHYGCP